jgi:lipoyl(octanoyl) transferase
MSGWIPPWQWLGRVSHAEASAVQRQIRERVLGGDLEAQRVLLCEHPPVITLGRSADPSHILVSAAVLAELGVEKVSTERGGEVTYHGPGQLMVYPVVRLRSTVTRFLQQVAGALSETLGQLGVADAEFRLRPAGIWVGARKIAACGLHVHRAVVNHGFAVNLDTPPAMWQLIRPCGMSCAAVSLAELRRERGQEWNLSLAEVAAMAGPVIATRLASLVAAPVQD